MAKRKVKRKAPKRKRKVVKRKVVKRKRKAPKRRRKRKFGSFIAKGLSAAKEKAAAAAKAVGDIGGKAKTMFIDLGGKQILKTLGSKEIAPGVPGLDVFKLPANTKLKGKNAEIAKVILGKMDTDCSDGDVDFKGTISYFKETVKGQGEEAKKKAEELQEALYKMLDEKKIHTKAQGKWKEVTDKILGKLPPPVKLAVTTQLKLNEYSKFTDLIKSTYAAIL